MRLAPSAFGGGSPNALLALSERRAATAVKHLATAKAGSRLATTRVHCPQFLSYDFPPLRRYGAVFINTILRKESNCLSEFGVTNETKTGYRSFICSACYTIFMYSADIYGSSFYKYRLISFAIYDIL